MQNFDIIKESKIKKKSFRVASICDQFDFNNDIIKEHFTGNIDIPEKWNIGLIVGKSGTGKTTIAKKIFGNFFIDFKYENQCVVDDFPKDIDFKVITKTFQTVGFSSVPSWLKPYNVLSNGEKMRVDLARALLLNQNIIIFDEYTSVIDREIAKIGALSTHNIVKKMKKKFIAISCHYDIIEWLNPDWIFSTDEMKMISRRLLRRPEIKIEIRKARGYWNIFRRYHYLNNELNKSSEQYVGLYNNKPIIFCAVINFPHKIIKPMRKIHRIVTLPDYQGLGLAIKFINFIANIYYKKGEYIGITTSLNFFAKSLMKNNWKLIRLGRIIKQNLSYLKKTESSNRNTFSLRYIPNI